MQVRVFVIMEGGLIQNVVADGPAVVDVVVVDYDTDGVPIEETTMVRQDYGDGKEWPDERAVLMRWGDGGLDVPTQALHDKAVKMFGEGG